MKLYKYVIAERIDILKNSCLRFTQRSDLNDLFEMQPYFEEIMSEATMREYLTRTRGEWIESSMKAASAHIPREYYPADMKDEDTHRYLYTLLSQQYFAEFQQLVEQSVDYIVSAARDSKQTIRQIVYDVVDDFIGTLCLTEKLDNKLMWAHYSESSRGFLIEFDKLHPFFRDPAYDADFGHIRKVSYVDERITFATFKDMTGNDLCFTKGREWEYEQEWRMLRPLKEATKIIGSVHLFAFPTDCVTGVVFGPKMPDATKREIAELLESDSRYAHVRRFQATLSETSYGIEIVPSDI